MTLHVTCRLAALLCLATSMTAQVDRYELGLRLRASERRLAAATDPVQRNAALAEFDRAVQAFFRLDLAGVARALDEADRRLGAADTPATRFAASLQLVAPQRLVDAASASATFELRRAYDDDDDVTSAPPADLSVHVEVVGHETAGCDRAVEALPLHLALPLGKLGAGDFVVRWRVCRGTDVLSERTQGLSLVDDLDGRLAKLDAAANAATSAGTDTVENRSLPHLLRMLRTMTRRRGEETVLPGHRLLREAEALAADRDSRAFCEPGQHWLVVPTTKGPATLRLFVPAATDAATRRPLVLALHGAGGSENLFFDGYGDGAIVGLCAARGWLLAAPRCGTLGGPDLPALIDALAARWPVDTQRVLLVGHSMGAGLAVAAASRAPTRFAAVAALAGGGALGRAPELQRLPFFVGTGSRDFLAAGARSLRGALEQRGVPTTFRDYPDVEHLTVVQFALPEVFAFFDTSLTKR